MNSKQYRVKSEDDFKLSKFDTGQEGKKIDKDDLSDLLKEEVEKISDFQYKLYAENRQSLLIILQGMDSSGKDGTIKQIMKGVNPQGVEVHSFKHPSSLELEHDFLWRHAIKLPERGKITIFNRSHYENVLISKVHPELVLAERLPGIDSVEKVNEEFWMGRYKQINLFEESVIRNGTQILKFFLHISKGEQRDRFLERLENKERHWKFSAGDITERGFWDQYQLAYEDALKHTSTKIAPWYVIPADDKSYMRALIANIISEKLVKMAPAFPHRDEQEIEVMEQAKKSLMQE